jgi:hypothetical protein
VICNNAARVRRSDPSCVIVAVATAFVLAFASGNAAAFEREWHAGAKLGVATLTGTEPGPALELRGAYGLDDKFDVLVQALGSHQFGDHDANVFSGTAGFAYKIDVFEWIPYIALLGGYYHYGGAAGPHGKPGDYFGAAVIGGLDYLLRRDLALGADVGFHGTFNDGFTVPYFTATIGAEYHWGF